MIGSLPKVEVFHPGDMETRLEANGAFTWIGSVTDSEAGKLTGPSLVWTNSQSGQFSAGEQLNHLPPLGTNVITLTATGSDNNTASTSISIYKKP